MYHPAMNGHQPIYPPMSSHAMVTHPVGSHQMPLGDTPVESVHTKGNRNYARGYGNVDESQPQQQKRKNHRRQNGQRAEIKRLRNRCKFVFFQTI